MILLLLSLIYQKADYSIYLNGIDAYVDCGNDILNLQTQGTVEIRCMLPETLPTSPGNYILFGVASSYYINNIWLFSIYRKASGDYRLRIGHRVPSVAYVYGHTNIPIGEWVHLVLTGGGGEIWKMYVNGIKQNITVLSGSNTGNWWDKIVYFPGNTQYTIGVLKRSSGNIGWLEMYMDEIRIYDRILDSTEVVWNYKHRLPKSTDGLVMDLRVQGLTGDTLYDTQDNLNTILVNATRHIRHHRISGRQEE